MNARPTPGGGELITYPDGTTERHDRNGNKVGGCDKKCKDDKKNKDKDKARDKDKKKEDSKFKKRVAFTAGVLDNITEVLGYIPGWICNICAAGVLILGAVSAILYLVAGKIGKAIATIIGVGLGALAGGGAKKLMDTLVSRYWVKALQLTSHLRGKQGRRLLARALTTTYATKVDSMLASAQGIMASVYSSLSSAVVEE
ncbi:hypothetical protein [Micromonospora sp. NBC_01638]|uniref:hypothetical protein n=1 Tax=Micromonospora sp. NBC_01638 TaxID=2975982 RepID=UPI00386BA57D|nr:T-complex 10 C-terminal domain-containing protein [Micromonospora sp. NBC_01638]